MKYDEFLDILIKLLLFTKTMWILLFFVHIHLVIHNHKYEKDVLYVEDFVRNVFTLLLGVLLIYMFNDISSGKKVCVKGSGKFALYVLGIIILLSTIKKIVKTYFYHDTLLFIDEIV